MSHRVSHVAHQSGSAGASPSLGPVALRRILAFAVFLFSFVVYNLNGRCIPTHDTLPARLLPIAVLTTGTLTLDQFGVMSNTGVDYFYTTARDGRRVSSYPAVVPLLVTPFFIPAAAYVGAGADPTALRALLDLTEKVSASFIAAASVAVMWLLLSRWASPRTAVVLTFAYAFGTETWMISSQALWQHGLAELLLGGLLLVLGSQTTAAFAAAGTLSALLIANRPPTILFAMAAAAFIARTTRRGLVPFIAAGTPIVIVWLAYNVTTFGTLLGGYGRLMPIAPFHALSIAGLLISPGRGLLVFAPFFAFLIGLPAIRGTRMPPYLAYFLAVVPLHFLIYAKCLDWTGGECFGPRSLADLSPILILALAPVVDRLHARGRLVFAIAVVYAIAVQTIGAFCYEMGGSGAPRDQWSWASNQYFIELRAGPAQTSFREWYGAARVAGWVR